MNIGGGPKSDKMMERENRVAARKQLEQSMLSGEALKSNPVLTGDPIQLPPIACAGHACALPSEDLKSDSFIRVANKHIPVKLSVSYTAQDMITQQERTVKFAVEFEARDVQITDEFITLILDDTLKIYPPVFFPMDIFVDGEQHRVVNSGISPTISDVKFMSFIPAPL